MSVAGRSAWEGPLSINAADVAAALGLPTPTPAQQSVIEAPPTPALVVAGAGSGKTETMAGRVVWLVANGHVAREEILGLTFTRKAAGELAERIGARLNMIDEYGRRGLLPHLPQIVASRALARVSHAAPGPQRSAVRRQVLDELAVQYGTGWDPRSVATRDLMLRPRVSTYNAFADSIVREHAARIGRDPDAAMLTQAASWLIAYDIVVRADLPGLEDIDRSIGGLVDAVQRLAADALDHRADLSRAVRIAADMAASFEPGRSNTTIDGYARNLESLGTLTELVEAYRAEKQRRGVLDFADQVAGAYDIVESAPDVRAELREQYRIVLLDEYQDTSVIQTRFLAELFRDSAVMAVGDPHQSIYGWRGASADNLYAFARSFADELPVQTHNLMTSWRNDSRILDVANRLLGPLQRPGLDVPPLEPRPSAAEGTVGVRYPLTVDDEAEDVAEWFAERRATHSATHSAAQHDAAHPGTPHTGAILFRSKRHMPRFAQALAARGIPHRILGLGGLLTAPEVVDVVSALRVLHDPNAGSALIRLLVGPRFSVGVADMAALHGFARELSRRDSGLMPLPDELRDRIRSSRGADEAVSVVDAVDVVRRLPDDYRLLQDITPEGRERIRAAGEMFERLRRAMSRPLPELLRQIELELRLDIELAANESRGPARSAGSQLRAFAAEVRAFLEADDRGTLGSLLAWIDKAESTDELMPRPEPPEPGVVQLLTIHGAKGLEWDAVAVVRMVDGELPATTKDASGWFGFGVLPFPLRGDRAALPSFTWSPPLGDEPDPTRREKAFIASLTSTSKKTPGALTRFKEAYGEYQAQEERRLAYVAVTRARTDLLLTGAHWAGQSKPRKPSGYLTEAVAVLGVDPIEVVSDDDNPYDGAQQTLLWPLDPLGARRPVVMRAAEQVQHALAAPHLAVPTLELARLLTERDERLRGAVTQAPTRVPASRFKDYVTDYSATVRAIARPMPERPYRQTRLGTLFHAWVEHRSGLVGSGSLPDDALWETDHEAAGDDSNDTTAAELARLRENFERSEWASLQPIEVESEIHFALPLDGEQSAQKHPSEHIVICKLDAVYRRADRGGRIEIVDWKTGRAPKTAAERDERMLQLALYRLAYHHRHGVPLEEIDVALYYVAEDLVIRGDRVYSEEELVQRWSAARAAR